MEVVDNPSSLKSKDNKNLRILVTILLVLLIIVASVAVFLYVQLMQENDNSYAQPRYVQLLKSQQVSNATGLQLFEPTITDTGLGSS